MRAPAAQVLRCAGCGAAGQPPTIVWDKRAVPPGVVLVPVFGWHEDGRPALLCPTCKRRLKKNRGRARYSKPRPRAYGRGRAMTWATVQEALDWLDDHAYPRLKPERRAACAEAARDADLKRFIPDRLEQERREALRRLEGWA
jgi:hypothetical protein